jgi:hypothetical protein
MGATIMTVQGGGVCRFLIYGYLESPKLESTHLMQIIAKLITVEA